MRETKKELRRQLDELAELHKKVEGDLRAERYSLREKLKEQDELLAHERDRTRQLSGRLANVRTAIRAYAAARYPSMSFAPANQDGFIAGNYRREEPTAIPSDDVARALVHLHELAL